MLEAFSEYWVYIGSAVAVIALLIFLLGSSAKQHIDIDERDRDVLRPTLDRNGGAPSKRPPSPYPYRFRPPPRSPLPRDNMLVLKGVGPQIASRLDTFNFTRFEHIAVWREDQYEAIAEMLGEPVERIIEDRWVEQAKLLAAERYEEYEAIFGKINQADLNRFKEDSF